MNSHKTEKNTTPRLIAAVVLLFGITHAVFTVLHLLPASPIKNATSKITSKYINTFFSQNWHLFSPNPGTSYRRLQVRCENKESNKSEWIDPIARVENEHFYTRVTGRSKILYVYRGVGNDLWDDAMKLKSKCKKNPNQLNEEFWNESSENEFCRNENAFLNHIQKRPAFLMAKKLATNTCNNLGTKSESQNTDIRIMKLDPLPFSKRELPQQKQVVAVLELYKKNGIGKNEK